MKTEMLGRRFGRLVVTAAAPPSATGRAMWQCLCDCGGSKVADGGNLRDGKTQSCNCLRAEAVRDATATHGMTRTPTWISWVSMRSRCLDPNQPKYPDYGGRGITVCERWRDSFENFLADMGERPAGMTLDRRDVNGNYEPANCRWATATEQARNKRNSRRPS